MTEKKINILWISTFPPISKATAAGTKTFHYYFNFFCKNDGFKTRLLTCANKSEQQVIEEELSDVEHSVVYWSKSNYERALNFINIESKYNPLNRNACLISNTDEKKLLYKLKEWEKMGYNPDVIILEWTNMVVLAPLICRLFHNSKIVASEHDVTFIGYKRKAEYFNNGLYGKYWKVKAEHEKSVELKALSCCDLILPQNSENISVLKNEGLAEKRIESIVPYYNNMMAMKWEPQTKNVLFFGAMGRPENSLSAIWFIKHVMPLLYDTGCKFIVLGSNPSKELLECESESVHITGFVESIEPYFSHSLCLVAPLVLGAGIKVKVLEGLSAGIPVLTNNVGIEGIPAIENRDYYHCEKPDEYAQVIRDLLDKSNVTIGINAKKMISEKFSLENSAINYKDMIIELVGGVL